MNVDRLFRFVSGLFEFCVVGVSREKAGGWDGRLAWRYVVTFRLQPEVPGAMPRQIIAPTLETALLQALAIDDEINGRLR